MCHCLRAALSGMKMPPRIVAWLPVAVGVLASVLAVSLAQWQLGRAEQKRALQARWDAGESQPAAVWHTLPEPSDAWLYRRVRVTGKFGEGYQVYLDNRLHKGQAGYHVVAPLRLSASGASVLINRGWLRGDTDRRNTPFVAVPQEAVAVEGILVRAQTRYLELGSATVQGMVWQNLDLKRYRELYPYSLPDWLILQTDAVPDNLLRDWPKPDTGVDKHISYAGQWFALAATSLALTLIYLWRLYRGRKTRAA